jgi:putative sigma-54 modulation protein
MKSNYTFKHLDHSDSLVNYTKTKLDELGKFLLKDGRCNVYYFKNQHEFVVEVSLSTKQKHFKASASAPDVYVAVDLMADKLEKQFIKIKEIYMSHKKFDLSKEGRLKELNNQFEYQPRWKKAG